MTCCSATGCGCLSTRRGRSVSEACRVFGVHRSTYYVWKRRVERHGLEILRPRERRRPRMPQPVVTVCRGADRRLRARPSRFGPRRIASELRRRALGRDRRLPQRRLALSAPARLNTRAKRLSLVAGYAAPYQPPREPEPERHVEAERPGELVGIDCFFVGRLHRHERPGLAADRDRRLLLVRLGRTRQLPAAATRPARRPQSSPAASPPNSARRLAARARAQRQRRRVPLQRLPHHPRPARRPPHADPRRPPANQRPRRSPAPADPRRMLATRLRPLPPRPLHRPQARPRTTTSTTTTTDRVHHGRLTRGRIPADIVYAAHKVKTR